MTQHATDDELTEIKTRYCLAVREFGAKAHAAAYAGRSTRQIDRYLADDEEFRHAADEARKFHADTLLQEVLRRGWRGVPKPVFYLGKIVGHVTEYSDRLLELLIKTMHADFGGPETLVLKTEPDDPMGQIDFDKLDNDEARTLAHLLRKAGAPEEEEADGTEDEPDDAT